MASPDTAPAIAEPGLEVTEELKAIAQLLKETKKEDLIYFLSLLQALQALREDGQDIRIALEPPATLGVHISEKAKALGIGLPERRHMGDAGYDLRTIERVVIEPGQVGKFPTGLNFNLPGHDQDRLVQLPLLILPRTGLAAGKGLYPMAWVVDPGYRAGDEDGLTLALRNLGQETLVFEPGDRVAQGLLIPTWTPKLIEIQAEEVDETERGDRRLGSSGIK